MVIALICDDSLNGLGIARSLQHAGAQLVVVARPESVLGNSKLVDRVLEISDLDAAPEAIEDFLRESSPSRVVPFPGSDRMLSTLASLAEEYPHMSFPDDPLDVSRFSSKVEQHRAADQAGLTTPNWSHFQPGEPPIFSHLPAVVRPADRSERPDVRAPLKVEFCRTQAELSSSVEKLSAAGFSSIVTSEVEGEEQNLFTYGGYAFQGDVKAEFVGRKLWHTYPTRVAAVAESVDDQAVRDYGRSFMKQTGLSGLFQVEVKRDERDGELYLIEMNQRNWLWGELASTCGVNLPKAKLWEEGADCKLERPSDQQTGPQTDGIFVNEYGVLSNIWGYRSMAPLMFVMRSVFSSKQMNFALLRRRDLGPMISGVRSVGRGR